MTKKTVIVNCGACPHKDHRGAFGKIAYIPSCGAMQGKELPYTETASNGRCYANPTLVIPEWCPLENNESA